MPKETTEQRKSGGTRGGKVTSSPRGSQAGTLRGLGIPAGAKGGVPASMQPGKKTGGVLDTPLGAVLAYAQRPASAIAQAAQVSGRRRKRPSPVRRRISSSASTRPPRA